MSTLVIDVQGFSLDAGFLVKEMAISDGQMINHFVFKPCTSYWSLTSHEKQQIHWLENNHHGLQYGDGHVDLSELPDILQRFTIEAKVIFVKGHQKKEFLKKYISDIPIVNLEFVENIPKLTKVTSKCCMYHHNTPKICALSNVYLLCTKIF